MNNLTKRLAELSPEKRKLLELRFKARSSGREEIALGSGFHVEKGNHLPLSFAQQRLWFLDQIDPGTASYNIPSSLRLLGALDVAMLERALGEIVRRHEALRTTFSLVDGEPVQVISPAGEMRLAVEELGHLGEEERETEVRRLAGAEAQIPFDLATGPLVRFELLRLGAEEHVLLLTMHHIVSDGWSMGVFFRELSALYGAFARGEESPLAELPIQYADYALWQRKHLQGEVLEKQLAYWKEKLSGAPAVLELPTDRPRPAVQSYRGTATSFVLPAGLSQPLLALSQREGATLYMTLLAAFQVLLSRYTRQEDMVVGTPIAGRTRPEMEGLVGFFVNTLALRTDLSGDPSFRELLARVRDATLGAYAHQDLPFERLVEEIQPERSRSHSPVFQVMFALQNVPTSGRGLPGLKMKSGAGEVKTAKFDLTLTVTETGQGLALWIEYSTDLFEASTIERMAEHFRVLLEGIAADPDQRITELPLLPAEEEGRILVEWNAADAEYPEERCIHELFAEQVERTPHAVAVLFEDQSLTYAELDARANQLAHHLRRLGVGPEVRVGICMERSLEMMVGLLGILKAGGAYVPLDPGYPADRLAHVLRDSRAAALVTQERLLKGLPEHGAEVVCLDRDWPAVARESEAGPRCVAGSANLAYVLYTSGSTGLPKGVQIPHRALTNFLHSMRDEPGLGAQDTLLAVTTLAFDIAGLELFLPLMVGARVVLCSREMASDGARLAEELADGGITVMQATPATWSMLVAAGWTGVERLKVLCGGEALTRELAAELQTRTASLWNLYGPTETTIWSAAARVDGGEGPVLMGRPIANTRIYVLDGQLRPVPVGVAGELYIGGDGLARGYLNRPELTAEKFLPDPFGTEPGARLYRTGDLVRYRTDGALEFLGRIDHQVKIRGFRIELGEIEAALAQHPQVRETVVLAREDVPGEKRLVAYVVAAQKEAAPSADELRGHLKGSLPDYMVPSAFVLLEQMPLTPNGKIDRRALPAVEAAPGRSFVAPRDSLERRLSAIWEELLRVRPIGVQDDFFSLGGHSLRAVRLMAEVKKLFGRDLPLSTLFEGATIEHLAEVLRRPIGVAPKSPLVGIQPAGSREPFFCVHPAGGNVLCYGDLSRHLGPDQPFYGLQHVARDGDGGPYLGVESMAASYLEALRVVQPEGPYFLGGQSFGGLVAFEMAQQLRRRGEQVALLALLDSRPPEAIRKLGEVADDALILAGLAREHARMFGKELSVTAEELRPLDPEAQMQYVFDRLKGEDVLLPETEISWIQKLIRTHSARMLAARSYEPAVYPGRVTLFRAREVDPMLVRNAPEIFQSQHDDPTFGWDHLTTEPVDVHVVPGDHATMSLKPHVRVLAERLRACMDGVSAIREESPSPLLLETR